MKLSFIKACPHCAKDVKFKLGDDWKRSLQCGQCSQEIEFYAPKMRYFLYTFCAFWFLKLLELVVPFLVAILILLTVTGLITIPFADLIKRKESYSIRSETKKMYPVVQMIMLATLVNSILIVGFRVLKL